MGWTIFTSLTLVGCWLLSLAPEPLNRYEQQPCTSPFPFCVFAKVVAIRGELACSSFGRNRLILQQKQQKTEHTQRAFSFAMKEIAMDKTRWIGSGFFFCFTSFYIHDRHTKTCRNWSDGNFMSKKEQIGGVSKTETRENHNPARMIHVQYLLVYAM